ncbi:MAG TPA: TlpA disulfide reductase family protein [Chitinispirillaceae bacterium]|nr:TlpA disulfide reductase family protein [Chitinispirillaceae bacterium]
MLRFVPVILCLSAIYLQAGQSDKMSLLQPGVKAPTFSLPALDGERVSLRTYCGDTLNKPHINPFRHIVILSFWATYCEPCKKEIPELIQCAQKYTNDSIKIFCISIDKEGAAKVGPVVNERKYTLPVLLDPYCKTAERYGVSSLPALFVIDPMGNICYSSAGYNENESVTRKIDSLISQIRQSDKIHETTTNNSTDSVMPIVPEQDTGKNVAQKWICPKERWDAVIKVECGVPVATIADSLGVPQGEIRKWFTDLKQAATSLWDSTKTR